MPARVEEVAHAKEEGVQFHMLQNAKRILGENGKVTGIECLRYELGEPDASGRRRPVEIKGSEVRMGMDAVSVAIGTSGAVIHTSTRIDSRIVRNVRMMLAVIAPSSNAESPRRYPCPQLRHSSWRRNHPTK